ncbi:hypothetical protein GCM10025783_05780 [Amnibacterium soli]|uniref:TIR domain-containing protein n=1 Tax=Amnibacterium soli TaxID=1282736 RepID=A0ABP8YUQ9_9MICO
MTPKIYDLFISHASEDKGLVRPLTEALTRLGLRVWYDQFALKVGDSLSASIDKGLLQSRFGLVIISKSFLAKRWPDYEYRGLVAREISEGKVILPVWFGVTRSDVVAHSPTLTDKFAIDATAMEPLELAIRILEAVEPQRFAQLSREAAYWQVVYDSPIEKVKLSDLVLSAPRWETLPQPLLRRIRIIQQALWEIMPVDWVTTVTNFRSDMHPEREVEIWERAVATYLAINNKYPLSTAERSDLFGYLIGDTWASEESELLKRIGATAWFADARREASSHLPISADPLES